MNKNRPVNLDLGTMKFPPMAIASILHRISGIALFLLLPVMLCLLGHSLHSEDNFMHVKGLLTEPLYKLAVLAFGAAFIYHLLAGFRHILMDMGFGEDVCTGRATALVVIVLAVIFTLFLGIWIW